MDQRLGQVGRNQVKVIMWQVNGLQGPAEVERREIMFEYPYWTKLLMAGKDGSVLVWPVVEPGHGSNLGLVQFVVPQRHNVEVGGAVEDRLWDLLDQVVLQIQLLEKEKKCLMLFKQNDVVTSSVKVLS